MRISGSAAVTVGGRNNRSDIMYSPSPGGTLGEDWAQATISGTDPNDELLALTLVGTRAYTTGRDAGNFDGTAGESTDSGESWSFANDLGHGTDETMKDVVYDAISTRALVVGNDSMIQKSDETNLPPYITSDNGLTNVELSVAENTTAVTDVDATDDDGDGITYTKTGGAPIKHCSASMPQVC